MTEAFWDWNEHVPSDLIPAVKHIRHLFEDAGWKSRMVTQQCCYAALHPEQGEPDDYRHFVSNLVTLKALIGRNNTQFFHDLLKRETPSAILKAFFYFYQEVMAVQVKFSFRELLELGSANASRIESVPIDWAAWHVKSMIGSENFQTGLWLKRCCDVQSFDLEASDDFDFNVAYGEETSWTRWRAPRLVSMSPALGLPYEASRAWEREDEAETGGALKAFKLYFVLHLEAMLESCQGEAHLQAAKQESIDSPQPEDEGLILNSQGSNLPSGDADGTERDRNKLEKALKHPESNPTLTVAQAALAFQNSVSTIYRWIDEGKLTLSNARGKILTTSVIALLRPRK